jgi:hypothetical protein
MSFYSDISQYPDKMFPYLSDMGNRGQCVLLFFIGEEYENKEKTTGYRT